MKPYRQYLKENRGKQLIRLLYVARSIASKLRGTSREQVVLDLQREHPECNFSASCVARAVVFLREVGLVLEEEPMPRAKGAPNVLRWIGPAVTQLGPVTLAVATAAEKIEQDRAARLESLRRQAERRRPLFGAAG